MSSSDSSPSKTSSSSLLQSDERTCHVLPCNIEFQGMAPSHLYFRPVESPEGHYNSMFRGRGLTATKEGKKDVKMALISCQNDKVQVKASVDNVLEWHHEHDPDVIQMDDAFTSRVRIAQEWSEVGQALHDPIPLEE